MTVAGRIATIAVPLLLSASAAIAQVTARAPLVRFETPEKLEAALLDLLREKNGGRIPAGWEKRFKGALACAVIVDGRTVIYTHAGTSDRDKSIRTINIAGSLHGFGGTWGIENETPHRETASCVSINPFTSHSLDGTYSPTAKASTTKDDYKAFGSADTAYHENAHHVFELLVGERVREFTKKGGDAIAFYMLDEANARSRTFLSWMHRWLTSDSDIEREAIEKDVLNASGPFANVYRQFTDLYGHVQLKEYVQKHRAFPPSLHRLTLLISLDEISVIDTYRKATDGLASEYKDRMLTILDRDIDDVMSFNGDLYRSMYGMAAHLRQHPFLTGQATKQKLRPLVEHENRKDAVAMLLQFLEFASSDRDCSVNAPASFEHFLKRTNPAQRTYLTQPFVRHIVEELFDLAEQRLLSHTGLNDGYRTQAIDLLKHTRDHLFAGKPLDRAALKRPLTNPDWAGRPGCG